MGWWADRRERKRREREQREQWRKERMDAYHREYEQWEDARSRARWKAEHHAEHGDGNAALAWMKIYDDLKDKAPSYPYVHY